MAARWSPWPTTRPRGRRGFYTAFIPTTAMLGLLLSLAFSVTLRASMGEEAFTTSFPLFFGLEGGCRVPSLESAMSRDVQIPQGRGASGGLAALFFMFRQTSPGGVRPPRTGAAGATRAAGR